VSSALLANFQPAARLQVSAHVVPSDGHGVVEPDVLSCFLRRKTSKVQTDTGRPLQLAELVRALWYLRRGGDLYTEHFTETTFHAPERYANGGRAETLHLFSALRRHRRVPGFEQGLHF
jgi:hypothetical protein